MHPSLLFDDDFFASLGGMRCVDISDDEIEESDEKMEKAAGEDEDDEKQENKQLRPADHKKLVPV